MQISRRASPWPRGNVLREGAQWCARTRIRSFVTPYVIRPIPVHPNRAPDTPRHDRDVGRSKSRGMSFVGCDQFALANAGTPDFDSIILCRRGTGQAEFTRRCFTRGRPMVCLHSHSLVCHTLRIASSVGCEQRTNKATPSPTASTPCAEFRRFGSRPPQQACRCGRW